MRIAIRHDLRALPRNCPDHRSPLWWGIAGLIAIEAAVVATLVVSYFYLRMGSAGWPSGTTEPPPLTLESLNVALLLAGAAVAAWAEAQAARDRPRRLTAGLGAALLCYAAVLALRWTQLRALPFRWDDHAYGSLVWTLSGFHFLHVASAVLVTSALAVLAARGHWSERNRLPLVVDRLYWWFVALAWLPLYLTIYWSEHLF